MSYRSLQDIGDVELGSLVFPLLSQKNDAGSEVEPKQKKILERASQWFGEWSLGLKIASAKVGNAIQLNENQRFFRIPLDTAILNVLRGTIEGDLKALRSAAYTYCTAMKAFVNACGNRNIPDAQMHLKRTPDLKFNGVTSKLPGERVFYTCLTRACNQGSADMVSFLLKQKADPSGIQQSANNHPLLAACFSNSDKKLEVVSLLLSRKVDPNMNLKGLNNPVLHILMYQHFIQRRSVHMLTETVKLLVGSGAIVKGPIAKPLSQSDFLTQSNLVDLSNDENDEDLTANLVLAGGEATPRVPVPFKDSLGEGTTGVLSPRFTSSCVQYAYEKAIVLKGLCPLPTHVNAIIFAYSG